MWYKLVTRKITQQYEYSCSNINTVETYSFRPYVEVGWFIYEKYIKDSIEESIEYIQSDYSIQVGAIVNGFEIKKVEVKNGEIILFAKDVISKKVNGSITDLEKSISDEIVKEFNEKMQKYTYKDIVIKLVEKIEEHKLFEDNSLFYHIETHLRELPIWFSREDLNYRNYVRKILSFDINSLTGIELTPLEKYALNKMFKNYRFT